MKSDRAIFFSDENENETIETLQATLKRLTEEIRVLQYALKYTAKRQCTDNAINPTTSGAAAMEYTQSESQAMHGANCKCSGHQGPVHNAPGEARTYSQMQYLLPYVKYHDILC